MAFFRTRPASPRRLLAVALGLGLAVASGGVARAGRNDLQLLNLCPQHDVAGLGRDANGKPAPFSECSWVQRDPSLSVTGINFDSEAQTRFRSLMSELGVAIAPRLQTPADTLGYAGFQFSAELGVTKISSGRDYWNGVEAATTGGRPDSYLMTVGGFVRKGMWLPLPALEFGAGALNIVGSRMYVVQGYAKLALQEGFHGWALPSLAVRGSVSQLLGTDQVDLNVYGLDVLISKAFGIAGTARLEPFLGWNVLFIDAHSGVIDATPSCDAVDRANNPTVSASGCPAIPPNGQTFADLKANFSFPQQSLITRQRWSIGFKLKMSVVFLVAEFDLAPAGHTTDQNSSVAAARDTSATQQSFALSAGFDF